MNILEIIGVIVGLVYLYWEYKASAWLWVAGTVMPAIYIIIYTDAGFYADMGINVYYLLASIYGLVVWLRKRTADTPPLVVGHTPRQLWLSLGLASSVIWGAIYWILSKYTDSTVALGDSFTTALSIVGLWMLMRKYVEQWLVWVAVDVVCAVLYLQKDLAPTGILYALYTIIAIFGYFKWCKMAKKSRSQTR